MSKTRQTFLALMLILPGSRALAQPWYLPTDGVDSVLIENTSKRPLTVWMTGPVDTNGMTEANIDLGPLESKLIVLKEQKNWPWLQIRSYEQLPVKVTAYSISGKTRVNPGRSETLSSSSLQGKMSGTLVLTNLTPIGQEDVVVKTSLFNSTLVRLGKFESTKIHVDLSPYDKIEVLAHYPISATFISDTGITHLIPAKSKEEFTSEVQSAYFLMVNQDHSQSFVFKADNQELAMEARKQIANPNLRKILFAKIQKGNNQTNRDLASPLKTVWSWSVDEVSGFGTFGSQECDGSPQLVEDYLIPWLSSHKNICFWGYRIERELTPREVQTGNSP